MQSKSGRNLVMRQALVAGALALSTATIAFLVPSGGHASMSKDQRKQVMLRTVFILALQEKNGELQPFARGSGTILTHDGAVLTNHHVVWNDAKNGPADAIIIGLTVSFDKEPEFKCIAFPKDGVLNEEYDLALVKCQKDMDGKPWRGGNWPTITVGSSEDLVPGDEISVIGYPGIGGYTINYTTGKVSGFVGKDNETAGRFWIKTDADIASGNSGGTAVDEEGLLIGVPSAVLSGKSSAQGRVGLIRPIEHARDFINLANSGWEPGQQGGGGGMGGGGGSGGGGFGGGGQQQQQPPPKSQGVIVQSTVRATDNNAPIAGALVVILKPGVRVEDLNDDNLEQSVLTVGRANSQGRFTTSGPVPKGGKYAVVVIADGFEPLYDNGALQVAQNAPDPFDPWGVITLRRK
jgi:S1-C subfamily serine protease